MKLAIFASLACLFLSHAAFAANYNCELKARENLMDPFASMTKPYSGDRPVEITVKGFTLKFIPTIVEGEDRNALWLGEEKDLSAVTTAQPGQPSVYLNLLMGERFAVGECKIVQSL